MISSHWTKRRDQQHSDLWFIFIKRHTKHIIVDKVTMICFVCLFINMNHKSECCWSRLFVQCDEIMWSHTNTHWISQSKYWQYCNINDILHRMICVVMLCIVITVVMRALYIYDVNKISERPCNYVLFVN
jgi:hypothetical protein